MRFIAMTYGLRGRAARPSLEVFFVVAIDVLEGP